MALSCSELACQVEDSIGMQGNPASDVESSTTAPSSSGWDRYKDKANTKRRADYKAMRKSQFEHSGAAYKKHISLSKAIEDLPERTKEKTKELLDAQAVQASSEARLNKEEIMLHFDSQLQVELEKRLGPTPQAVDDASEIQILRAQRNDALSRIQRLQAKQRGDRETVKADRSKEKRERSAMAQEDKPKAKSAKKPPVEKEPEEPQRPVDEASKVPEASKTEKAQGKAKAKAKGKAKSKAKGKAKGKKPYDPKDPKAVKEPDESTEPTSESSMSQDLDTYV